MSRLIPFALAATVLLLAACRPVTPTAGALPAGDPLTGTSWVLTELNGQPALAETDVTLEFAAGGRAGGSDGCNRYSTSYTADGDTIQFSPNAAATMMACPEPIMAQAQAYFTALTGAATFNLDGGNLALVDAGSVTTAVFAPVSQSLAGTAWQVTAFNNGQQAVVGVIEGTTLTASFGGDGLVSGSGGCNNFTGSYTSDGAGAIQIGPLASTMMACVEPAGAMEQEAQYLAALASAATYRVEGDQLEMRTADDALAVLFVRSDAVAAESAAPGDSAGTAGMSSVTGTVVYLERSALAADAMVVVSIHNKQLADAPPEMTLLGTQAFLTEGQQVPIPYEVFYSPEDVMEGALYSIGATIRDGGGNLLFVSTTVIPVITQGNPTANVEILVQPVK